MPTVYVTQLPHRRNPETGTSVPTYNIGPAAEHGDVAILFPPQAPFHDGASLIRQLRVALAGYSFADGDSVIVLGDIFISSAAIAVLAQRGPFTVLRWDRNLGRYLKCAINVMEGP